MLKKLNNMTAIKINKMSDIIKKEPYTHTLILGYYGGSHQDRPPTGHTAASGPPQSGHGWQAR